MPMDHLVAEGKSDCSLIFAFLVSSDCWNHKLCLHLRMVSFYILTSSVGGIVLPACSKWCFCLSEASSKPQAALSPALWRLIDSLPFWLASDSFSVIVITLIFLCLSELLGLYCVWLHSPSGIKLVIDLILQFISVAWITLQMTLCTSWNWIGH